MMKPVEPLYFVHMSDTHFGATKSFARHGHVAFPCAQRAVEIINTLPVKPDFVVHTGDVVTQPEPEAYRLAAEVFAGLNVPIYFVTGNHDSARMIREFLPQAPAEWLVDDPDCLSYRFEVKGYRFLVLDGRGPDRIDPHGIISEEQLVFVREETQTAGPPLTVFLHFPVVPMHAPWMDANMLLLNGFALHDALLAAGRRLRGVFHGHIHQSMQVSCDGICYTAVPSTFSQFGAWPVDVDVSYDPDYLPGFNFVQLLPEQTIVHQHTFVRPIPGDV